MADLPLQINSLTSAGGSFYAITSGESRVVRIDVGHGAVRAQSMPAVSSSNFALSGGLLWATFADHGQAALVGLDPMTLRPRVSDGAVVGSDNAVWS